MNLMKKRRAMNDIPTQREIAAKLGVSVSAVSKWENGVIMPRMSKLPRLAELYGCSVDELLDYMVNCNEKSR